MMSITYSELLKEAMKNKVKTTDDDGNNLDHEILQYDLQARINLNITKVEMTEIYKKRGEEAAKKYEIH
jgi:hypothetical protein